MPFVKCLSGFAEVPYQVSPWSLPDAPRMATWYQPRRHVRIVRFLLRSAFQGGADLVPGWKARFKHKQICGIVLGLGGWQKLVSLSISLSLCVFFGVMSYGREKTHKQKHPQKSQDNRVKLLFMCVCVFLCLFFSLPGGLLQYVYKVSGHEIIDLFWDVRAVMWGNSKTVAVKFRGVFTLFCCVWLWQNSRKRRVWRFLRVSWDVPLASQDP